MRRAAKVAAWSLACAGVFGVLGGGLLWFVGLERAVLRLSDGRAVLSGVHFAGARELSIARLTLTDRRGVWLVAEQIAVRWHPAALLRGRLQIDDVRAVRVALARAPEGGGGGSRWLRIEVAAWSVGVLQLSEALAGQAAALSAGGSVRLHTLEDATADLSARRLDGEGRYDLHLRLDPARIDATLQVHEPAGGPLENILRLPGLGALEATIRLQGPQHAARLDAALAAGVVRARAAGSVDLPARTAEIEYSLQAGAAQPRAHLSWERIDLRGRWHAGLLDAHARIDGLLMPGVDGRLLRGDSLRIDADMHVNETGRPLEFSVNHRLFTLQGRALTAGGRRLDFELQLHDLGPWAALAGEELRGSAAIKGRLTEESARTAFALDADAAIAGGRDVVRAALGVHPTLRLSGAWQGGAIDLGEARLEGRGLTLDVDGSAARDGLRVTDLRLRWALRVAELAALFPQLSGRVQAAGELRGRPEAPGGTLRATGSLDGSPLTVDLAVERPADGSFAARILAADWRSAHLSGALRFGRTTTRPEGRLQLGITHLSDLDPLLGASLQGGLGAELELASRRGQAYARLRIDASQAAAGPFAGNVSVTGEGPPAALALLLRTGNATLGGDPAAVSAQAELDVEARRLRLSGATANYRGAALTLLAPAQLSFAQGWMLTGLRIGVERAELRLDGRLTPNLDLQASLQRLGPAQVALLRPQLLAAGSLDVRAHLLGRPTAPWGSVDWSGSGLRLDADWARLLPDLGSQGSAQLRGDAAVLDAHLDAGRQLQLALAGVVPFDPGGRLDLRVNGGADLGLINPLLEAHGQQTAGQLVVQAALGGTAAAPEGSGTAQVTRGAWRDFRRGVSVSSIAAELTLDGRTLRIKSLAGRAASGSISMSGAVGVLQPDWPVDLSVTARDAVPIDSSIVTANLDADLRVRGDARARLDVAGTVHVNHATVGIPNSLPPEVAVLDVRRRGQAPPPQERPLVIGLDVTVQAPREILVQGRGLDAELGGELHLGGTSAVPVIGGGFDLQRGNFSLAGRRLDFTAGRIGFEGAGLDKKIDPSLDFTAQATLSDATATLRITGAADAPRFEFSSNPSLPQDEIMARLFFGESAAQLSTLQMAQIGAALATLSGVGDGGLNPLAKLQKSLRLDRLSVSSAGGTGTGTGSTAPAGASVAAGRYVSKHVYVEAKQSTTGSSQVQVDIDLTRHLKLQTRLGNGTAITQGTTPENDPGSSIGLSYQFEY